MKIRTRLTFQFALIVATLLLIFSLAVYFFSANYRLQEVHNRLRNRASNTIRLYLEESLDDSMQQTIERSTVSTLTDPNVRIYDSTNHLAYRISESEHISVTNDLLNQIRTIGQMHFKAGKYDGFGKVFNFKGHQYIAVSSGYDRYGEEELSYLKWLLLTLYLFGVIITFILGRVFSRQGLKPISNVIRQVDKITVTNLNQKVNEGNGTDEIAQLAITFNKMLARLKSSFELQKNFVANASHELRTPLTVLNGQIEVALMQDRSSLEYKNLLHSLQDDIRNMSKLTNHLLELAFVSRDVSEFKLHQCRIDELLLAARSELIKRHPEYRVQMNYNLPDNEDLLKIPASEQLLKSAFLNLMDNGCKFSADKSVNVSMSINGGFHIHFADTGIGISKTEQKQVFEPLYRSDNAKQFSGHGLGLALTQRIILLHRGTIKLISELNAGTTVEVFLPANNN